MDGSLFDRIIKTLSDSAPRRHAVKALAGASFAAVVSSLGIGGAEAKKNKRCRKRLQKCGGKKKCCNGSGNTGCHQAVKPECKLAFPGQRCCGKEGAPCGSAEDDCECCGALFCFSQNGNGFRCLEPET